MTCGIEKKVLAEIIGTFMLVFFGTGSAVIALMVSKQFNPDNVGIGVLGGMGDWIAIGLIFGLTIMVCIYLLGKISGAHLNPAVSIGLFVSKNISGKDTCFYIIAQVIGATLGSLALFLALGSPSVSVGGLGAATPGLGVSYLQTMFAELIGTFFLMLVIMGVAVDKKAEPGFAGISIGFTVAAVIAFLGPFTGGAINPARAFSPYLLNFLLNGPNLWIYYPIYLIGPVLGAILAALVYTYLAKGNDVCELPQPFQK